MVAKHWPWMVAVAGPMLAATLALVWILVSPPKLATSQAAATDHTDECVNELLVGQASTFDLAKFLGPASGALRRRQTLMFSAIDQNQDGSINAAEYREYLRGMLDEQARDGD